MALSGEVAILGRCPQPLRDQPVVGGIRAFREGGQVVIEEPGVAVDVLTVEACPNILCTAITRAALIDRRLVAVRRRSWEPDPRWSAVAEKVGPVKRKNCTSLNLNV